MKINIRHCYTLNKGVEKKMRIAKGKKSREIKANKIKNKSIIPRIQKNYVPRFTFHALERISERMCEPVKQRTYIDLNGIKVGMTRSVKWIRPKFLREVIKDISFSFTSYIYSTSSDTIMTKGKLAKYIIDRGGEVVTVITDAKLETSYMKKHKYTTIVGHSLELFLFPTGHI